HTVDQFNRFLACRAACAKYFHFSTSAHCIFTPFLSFDANRSRLSARAQAAHARLRSRRHAFQKRCKYQQSKSGDPKRVGVEEKLTDNQRECCSEADDEGAIATVR